MKKDGSPCGRPPSRGEDFCKAHHPEMVDEWRETGAKGGVAPRKEFVALNEELRLVQSKEDLLYFLNQVAAGTAGSAISAGQGAVLSQIANTMLRVLDSMPAGEEMDFASIMRAVMEGDPGLQAEMEKRKMADVVGVKTEGK